MKQLSEKITKILIAEDHFSLAESLGCQLQLMAPGAEIKLVTTLSEADDLLTRWRPVLAVLDFKLGPNCITELFSKPLSEPLAPFILGMSHCATLREGSLSLRNGFSLVIDKPFSVQEFNQAVFDVVEVTPPLVSTISQLVSPSFYHDTKSLDLKRFSEDVESTVISLAHKVTETKLGLSRLLGISRQLIQYHIRRRS